MSDYSTAYALCTAKDESKPDNAGRRVLLPTTPLLQTARRLNFNGYPFHLQLLLFFPILAILSIF